jgi:hypothetical protein
VSEQLALFADAELQRPLSTRAADRRTARAYVDTELARRVCVQCGARLADRALRFVHRDAFRGWASNVPICRLVGAGAHPARLACELARCEARCRVCHPVIERSCRMLGAERKRIDGIDGEGESAIRSGAKDVKRLAAKHRAFLWKVREIA